MLRVRACFMPRRVRTPSSFTCQTERKREEREREREREREKGVEYGY
jgi:hypothetical protein